MKDITPMEIKTANLSKRKSMKYKCIMATRRGSPEVLRITEKDLRAPAGGEVRIKILASSVSLPDVQARYSQTPFPPGFPFIPGYSIIGSVDAIGKDVTDVRLGDRVGSLTVNGGYAEFIFLDKDQLIPVPADLDPAEAVTLILNYLVAYQVLHRKAKVRAGDRVLFIGASGGIGTALLQLGRLADLKMYGIASRNKHHILTEMGAIPIDYRMQDFVEIIHKAEPDGLNAVFDGMGGDYLKRAYSVLKRGGIIVEYGNPLSFSGMVSLLARMLVYNLLPDGKSVKVYGTNASKFGRRPFLEDWTALFKLLEDRKIKPVIEKKFPILDAASANELLESKKVIGNIVLVAPELL